MIRHIWSVLCSKASIDRQTNNVSLFEVLESVQFATDREVQFPANLPFTGTIVSLWARQDPNTPVAGQMRVRLLSPTGDELLNHPAVIELQGASRTRNLVNLNGIRIAGNGWHEFEISWRLTDDDLWHQVASLPLDFTLTVDPTLGRPGAG
jgi:hypothetical protein